MSATTVDAKNRALRTFAQGLAANVIVAVVLLVLPVFTSASGWQDIDWKIMSFLLVQTVVVSALSYVMRAYTHLMDPPPAPVVVAPPEAPPAPPVV